ncbi:MAG: SMC family ATPase [Acidobacteria bacterium]|nr:SMC family ATPase [Acidobacteriota bacterium]
MIKSLHAVNFRRHADLDLRFDDDRQLVLIAGANGVGKSSILEAITFALWGEGRHGRRNLDTLVRRGAEFEGMSVELTFTIADETYRVHRRRDGKSVTAVLYANDIPLVEGPQAVTSEIASLLGMDAAGFRLAVIAQQKDLDGLASLRPAERAQMVTRLLRLDALTAARNVAAARFRSERDIAAALRGADPEEQLLALAEARDALSSVEIEINQSRSALAAYDEVLLANADVEERWNAAARDVARLEGALAQLEARRLVLQRSLDALVIPDVIASVVDLDGLPEELAALERDVARGEALSQNLRQREVAAEELERVIARLEEIEARQRVLAAYDVAVAENDLAGVRARRGELDARFNELRLTLGSLQGSAAALRERLEDAVDLGVECDLCGQDVSEEHRLSHADRLAGELAALDMRIEEVKDEGRKVAEAVDELRVADDEAQRALEEARNALAETDRLAKEVADLERRQGIYSGQLERLDVTPVDLDALVSRREEITEMLSRSAEHTRQVEARSAALTRHKALAEEARTLDEEIRAHADDLARVRPDADLTERHRLRASAVERRAAESEMLRHWETEDAVVRTRIAGLEERIEEARSQDARRQTHQQAALHAAAAARLLGDVSERLAVQIRPSLEGAVSSLLATMSEGRFAAVRISDEYTITVEDDGRFRPLGELSGGEIDLVALAVRLALAQVVSERHGSGGPGFLILDECFASQDSQRRQSILAALRNLRDVYSQIFLISHVENIEDSADMVVSVVTDETRSETEVLVS